MWSVGEDVKQHIVTFLQPRVAVRLLLTSKTEHTAHCGNPTAQRYWRSECLAFCGGVYNWWNNFREVATSDSTTNERIESFDGQSPDTSDRWPNCWMSVYSEMRNKMLLVRKMTNAERQTAEFGGEVFRRIDDEDLRDAVVEHQMQWLAFLLGKQADQGDNYLVDVAMYRRFKQSNNAGVDQHVPILSKSKPWHGPEFGQELRKLGEHFAEDSDEVYFEDYADNADCAYRKVNFESVFCHPEVFPVVNVFLHRQSQTLAVHRVVAQSVLNQQGAKSCSLESRNGEKILLACSNATGGQPNASVWDPVGLTGHTFSREEEYLPMSAPWQHRQKCLLMTRSMERSTCHWDADVNDEDEGEAVVIQSAAVDTYRQEDDGRGVEVRRVEATGIVKELEEYSSKWQLGLTSVKLPTLSASQLRKITVAWRLKTLDAIRQAVLRRPEWYPFPGGYLWELSLSNEKD